MSNPRGIVYQVFDRCALKSSNKEFASPPWIEYEFSIKLANPPTPPAKPSLGELDPVTNVEELDLGASGDSNFIGGLSPPSVQKSSKSHLNVTAAEVSIENPEPNVVEQPQRQELESLSSRQNSTHFLGPAKITQKTFSYKLMLKTIEFCRKSELGVWQISLHHPKAHTPITLTTVTVRETTDNKITNIELVLYFSAELNGIRSVIESEPCVLHIKGPHGFVATAELDNGTLLDQIEMQSDQVGIIIMENESADKVAMVQASAELTDLGANLNAQQRKFAQFLLPKSGRRLPHLDEELAYKMVEELEDWKTQQQEAFLVDLKRREINHLSRLTAEWTRRRTDLESALTHKLEQCTLLTSALEIANHNLRDKQKDEQERLLQFQESKVDLERSCIKKLMHLQELARRNETDAEQASKLASLRFDDLNNRFQELQQEHVGCKSLIAEQEKELEILRTLSLPTNEAAQLLQEMKSMHQKLARVQSSKSFYKQQWTNAVREMEKLESSTSACTNDLKNTETTVALCDNRLADMILSEKAHLVNEQEELRNIFETLDDANDC